MISYVDVLDGTEKIFQINLPDNQETIKTVLTEEVHDILVKTIINLISMEQNEEENDNIEISVYSEDILLSFADDMPKEPLTILKNNGVYLDGLFEYVDLLNQIYGINEVESDILKKFQKHFLILFLFSAANIKVFLSVKFLEEIKNVETQ